MHIRLAKASDLADLATVATRAMWDDDLTPWLAPYREQHPECLRQSTLRRAKRRYYSGNTVLAAVTDDEDPEWTGTEKVVGYLSAASSKQHSQASSRPWFSWNCTKQLL